MNGLNVEKIPLIPKLIAFMLISFFSALLLTASAWAVDAGENGSEDALYSDLNPSNPSFSFIGYLSQKGIISGYPDGSFKPESSLSRAEAAVVLTRTMGLELSGAGEELFWDLKGDHWAASYVAACVKAGYITGYPDGSFAPEEKLSRAQGISLVLRLSKQDMKKASLPLLEDVDKDHWAAPYIATGLAAGMVGLDSSADKFLPDAPFTREEMCLALGMLLTQDPDHYSSELKGQLIVESGEFTLNRAGQSRKIEKNDTIIAGDIIESGAAASAVINYPDGSSLLIKENTLISISGSQGREYITIKGKASVAVDWLNFEIKKGQVFAALATRADEAESEEAGENETAALTTLLAGNDSSRYIAAAEKSSPPWYKTAEQKKVKVKVDMPYGVAAIRGTVIMISIGSDGRCDVSCLSGNAELGNEGGSVNLNGGQSSGFTQPGEPPQSPAPMTQQQAQLAQQAQQWLQGTQQQMQQQQPAPTAPSSPGTPPGQQQQQPGSSGGGGGGDGGGGDGGSGGDTGGSSLKITSVADIIEHIVQGQDYQAPATITALMSNGTNRPVAVSWDNSSPDTSDMGTITLVGSVAGYTETITLTLIIESPSPIARIDDLEVTVEEEQPFELPETVTALLEDANTRQVGISWDLDNVDTSQPRTVILNGSVEGYDGIVKLTLNVKPKTTITKIEDVSVEITIGDSYSLPEQLTALMSDDSSKEVDVSWSPSEADSSELGEYEFSGSVEGYDRIVKLTLNVKEKVVIERIEDLNVEITAGDEYNLPGQLSALMSDDSSRQVAVSWSPSEVDSSESGEYEFSGSVEGYSGTVKLTLTINPRIIIKQIDNITASIQEGGSYSLPEQLTAIMSDNSSRQVAVVWTPSTVNTSLPGSYSFSGQVEGYSGSVSLLLTVNAIPPPPPPPLSIKHIDNLMLTINEGEPYSLPWQLTAIMSDNSSRQVAVSWSPSEVDSSESGEYEFSGSVEGYSGIVKLTLTINPRIIIKQIDNITASIQEGDSYSLPEQLTAIMSDDSSRQVAVSWSPSEVDSSQAGEYEFSGTVEGYSRTIKLTLNVKEKVVIERIEDLNVEITAGDEYSLPGQLTAIMSDDSSRQVAVSWSPSEADSSELGEYEFSGTVEGYSRTIKLTLNVKEKIVIERIEDLNVEITAGDEYSLPGQLMAIMSDDSSRQVAVSWSPSEVDSSESGEYEFSGTVEGYDGTIKLTLNVKEKVVIEKIEDLNVEITAGDEYSLPGQLTAIMSDDSTKQMAVVWTPSTVNTSLPGSYSFSGQVEGYSGSVSLLLTVNAIPPPPPPPPPARVAAPTANPPAGNYSEPQNITLFCATTGATIYYTIDGSDPRDSETRKEFSESIVITDDTTIKAYAKKGGMTDSVVMSFSYRIEGTVPTGDVIVTPITGSVTLVEGENLKLIVDALAVELIVDDPSEDLYKLEINHNLGHIFSQFSLYTCPTNPYGPDGTEMETEFNTLGVKAKYDAEVQEWEIDFGPIITEFILNNYYDVDGTLKIFCPVTFWLALKDPDGDEVWGSMAVEPTPGDDNAFTYTLSREGAVLTVDPEPQVLYNPPGIEFTVTAPIATENDGAELEISYGNSMPHENWSVPITAYALPNNPFGVNNMDPELEELTTFDFQDHITTIKYDGIEVVSLAYYPEDDPAPAFSYLATARYGEIDAEDEEGIKIVFGYDEDLDLISILVNEYGNGYSNEYSNEYNAEYNKVAGKITYTDGEGQEQVLGLCVSLYDASYCIKFEYGDSEKWAEIIFGGGEMLSATYEYEYEEYEVTVSREKDSPEKEVMWWAKGEDGIGIAYKQVSGSLDNHEWRIKKYLFDDDMIIFHLHLIQEGDPMIDEERYVPYIIDRN